MRTAQQAMKTRSQSQVGSMLVLVVCIICILLVPLLIVSTQMSLLVTKQSSVRNLIDAACLIAAKDMARVVINDPYFGYISLSNYPPVGKHTLAADGEPLPVIGINTLIGTVRQNLLIAQQLNNDDMAALAMNDRHHLDDTIAALNTALSDSLKATDATPLLDMDGNKIIPLSGVRAFLSERLAPGIKIKSIRLSNGWLSCATSSSVPVPRPQRLARIAANCVQLGEYKAFMEVPVGATSFTFAGVSRAPSLGSVDSFHEADTQHICSVVKLDCVFWVGDPPARLLSTEPGTQTQLKWCACAIPATNADATPPGVMTLRLPEGAIESVRSWSDFLNGNTFNDHRVAVYDAVGGDYPLDPQARIRQKSVGTDTATSREFAEHLYYWLRNGHLRPRLDAVLNMVADPFTATGSHIFCIYEFERDGTISRMVQSRDPFPVAVTSDSQVLTVADTQVRGANPAIIIFRNSVKNLGTTYGGKHAGQALPGYPVNWCELQEFGRDENSAALSGKGKMGLGLAVLAASDQAVKPNSTSNLFQSFDGKRPCLQPRQTYYSGGLAVDIEIGGISRPDPNADVLRMRRTNFHRKV
jgi:hypothetical protein